MSEAPYDTWVTKDGRDIKVTEMDDQHLANAKNYLERRLAKREYRENEIHDCMDPEHKDVCMACDDEAWRKRFWRKWIAVLDAEILRRANVKLL